MSQYHRRPGPGLRPRDRRQKTFTDTLRSTLIITPFVLALLVVLVLVLLRGSPDQPTDLSSDENLQRHRLPELPSLLEVTEPGESAGDRYLEIARRWGRDFDEQRALEPEQAQALLAAAGAGRVEEGFLDDTIPVRPMPFAGAMDDPAERLVGRLNAMGTRLVRDANDLRREGDRERALEYARAAFTLGYRMYSANRRLWCRIWGLEMMRAACGMIILSAPRQGDGDQPHPLAGRAREWDAAIATLLEQWRPKWQMLIGGRRPNVADTIRIAELDADPSFRYEAILTLGRVKHLTVERGNQRLIAEAFDRLSGVDDPWLSQAVEAARTHEFRP